MSIEEKYGIVYIKNHRYYKFDLSQEIYVLQNTIPYLFEYQGVKIFESAWNRLTIKVLELLDSINPISDEELLSLEYPWSNQEVFTTYKRVNCLKFKNLYINTNHTATHAGMNIKFLIEAYGGDINDCTLLIKRHPISEPEEVRAYYRNETKEGFRKCLVFQDLKDKTIETVINNFTTINKFLNQQASTGYDDFFLFDDYYYFVNYKQKTLDYLSKKYYGTKNYTVTETCLDLLDGFYKARDFFINNDNDISDEFKRAIETEIEKLFTSLNSNIISAQKLYARMNMLYPENMEKLGTYNTVSKFFTLVELLLDEDYYFKKPFISKEEDALLENDDIIMNYAYSLDEFTSRKISSYISKMHLKSLNSYLEFMINCSDYYVQVDVDRMVSKDKIDIESKDLEKIKKELLYYINSFGPINTQSYSDYNSLPSLEYDWNKYLLVGITRSYLNNIFEIEYTSNKHKYTDFIIKIK